MAETTNAAQVAVVGMGPWGAVLADLLSVNHERVLLWGEDERARKAIAAGEPHPRVPGVQLSPHIQLVDQLSEVAAARDIVFAVAPDRLRDVARRLGDHLRGDHRVLCAGQGFEPGSARRMSDIVREESCVKLIAALAGPRVTLEMAQGAPGGGVIGSDYKGVAKAMQRHLASPRYRVYTSPDRVGVELGPNLATVGIFVAGVVAGAGMGPGAQALVMSRALVESAALGEAMGADPKTFSGMSYLGVLTGSCLSRRGHDYRLGAAVGEDHSRLAEALGEFDDQDVLASAVAAIGLARAAKVSVPLHEAAAALLRGLMTPEELRGHLMTRPLTEEL